MVQLSLDRRRKARDATNRELRLVVPGATAEPSDVERGALLRHQDQRTLFPLLIIATLGLALLAARDASDGPDLDGLAAPDSATPYVPRIAVNLCHWSELCLLPGVSTTLAQRIVAARVADGPFLGPEDLRRVPGIGPVKQSQLSGWLDFSCARSPTGEGDTSAGRRLR